ncbi:tRNA pseudouridine(55) synthase TruB [Paenibacillus sp. 481]|uniref:tRNA pseudouridine(55) synthase TruB n=1 Tax=Paenibacillus sp. 481 TaxID=2835869 RepID=UPI001E2C1BD0|nr:tRNA pseudouridine(55) synthase TruB [Paenibacillus sp. 481]UHA73892.1 tRNA pseudouridine(55) synthase TruB [Paenibacillus sp. 481]
MTELHGVLPVWKPTDWTSHDVVARVRRIVREKRIGHTGTLDPQVVGVLPLCIGKATRLVEYLQDLPKQYEAVLRLGIATDTEDLSGEVIARQDASSITEEQVRDVIAKFVGEIEQVPPMYSAVKVNGKRLYELAREGKTVERAARTVTIYDIDLLEFRLGGSEPEVRFRVSCSKGTYIRTLCVDIGRMLGVPSTMAQLIRTMSAQFTEQESLTLEQIEQAVANGTLAAHLVPVDKAIAHLPKLTVNNEYASYATQGKGISLRALQPMPLTNKLYRLYDEQGTFYGIFNVPEPNGALRPVKVFLPS